MTDDNFVPQRRDVRLVWPRGPATALPEPSSPAARASSRDDRAVDAVGALCRSDAPGRRSGVTWIFCRRYQDDIANDLDSWTTVPGGIREHPEATQQYADVLSTVAQVLAAQFGRTELLERLTGDEPDELRRWELALGEADALVDTDPERARRVLEDALTLGTEISGSRIDRLNALTNGRLGTLAYRQNDIDAARSHTEIALGASLAASDVDGVMTYVRNLYDLEREQGNPEAALVWAQRQQRSAETGGRPSRRGWREPPRAKLGTGARADALEHARSAASLARERLSDDPDMQSVVLNNAGDVLPGLASARRGGRRVRGAIARRRSAGDHRDVALAKRSEPGRGARSMVIRRRRPGRRSSRRLRSPGGLLPPDDLARRRAAQHLAGVPTTKAESDVDSAPRTLYAEALAVREAARKQGGPDERRARHRRRSSSKPAATPARRPRSTGSTAAARTGALSDDRGPGGSPGWRNCTSSSGTRARRRAAPAPSSRAARQGKDSQRRGLCSSDAR